MTVLVMNKLWMQKNLHHSFPLVFSFLFTHTCVRQTTFINTQSHLNIFYRVQDANASTGSFIGEYDFNTMQWHWQLLRLALDTLIQLFSLFIS